MTATCRYCGNQAVEWKMLGDRWALLDRQTGENHKCAEYETAHPKVPAAAMRKNPNRKGAFLRWYGPRSGRLEAVLVQPTVDPDSPAGFYAEPQYSTYEQSRHARGLA